MTPGRSTGGDRPDTAAAVASVPVVPWPVAMMLVAMTSVALSGCSSSGESAVGEAADRVQVEQRDDASRSQVDAASLQESIEAFVEQPSSDLGSSIAAGMVADGDRRWGPWLLDLLRLGPSTGTDRDAAVGLAVLSGIDRPDGQRIIDDYRIYGQWVYDEAVDPGPGYREWKIGLYSVIDDSYEELLRSVDDDVLLSRIQWGGVARGGIPELDHPVRLPAAEASWMTDDEIVFGVVIDGVAVAYPFRILGHHELANDTVGGTPVAVVFCTLCRTASLFDRRVGAQALGFQTSGLVLSSNKVMVDIETDTLWSHLGAVGIGGRHDGVELRTLPLETVTWAQWRSEHPGTEVLDLPAPIFGAEPEQPPIAYDYEPDAPYRFYYENPDVWFPILDTPTDGLEVKDEVFGLQLDGETLAVQLEALGRAGPSVFELGGRVVLLVPGPVGARAYDAEAAGLSAGPVAATVRSDGAGAAVGNGIELPRLPGRQGFWLPGSPITRTPTGGRETAPTSRMADATRSGLIHRVPPGPIGGRRWLAAGRIGR